MGKISQEYHKFEKPRNTYPEISLENIHTNF